MHVHASGKSTSDALTLAVWSLVALRRGVGYDVDSA